MIRAQRWIATLISGCLLSLAPSLVWACSVCAPSGDSEASVQAFRFTTAFMSFFPLILIGGTMYWVWRRFNAAASDERPVAGAAADVVGLPSTSAVQPGAK